MKSIKKLLFLSIITIALISCSKDNANDPAQLSVKIEGVSSSVSNGRVSSNVVISEALIGVTKFKLEMEGEDDHHDSSNGNDSESGDDDGSDDDDNGDHNNSSTEFKAEGKWIVNLLDGTSTPDLPVIGIEPGQFTEAKIVLSPIIDDQYSVVFKATYTNDLGEEVPVEIMLSNEIIFKVENDAGLSFSADKLNELVVQLELDKWLSEVDLNALKMENGKIRISIDHNEGAIDKISINIKGNCGSRSDDHQHKNHG